MQYTTKAKVYADEAQGATSAINLLKLVSAIFYEIFIFSPNDDSPSKTIKNVFYFIEKALFVLEIFTFL